MSAILLNMASDMQGNNAYAPRFTTINYGTTLSQNTLQNFTVPSNFEKWIAVFSYSAGADIFVSNNNDSEVPGSSFSSTTSQLCPATRLVNSGDILSFITSNTSATVLVSLYGYDS